MLNYSKTEKCTTGLLSESHSHTILYLLIRFDPEDKSFPVWISKKLEFKKVVKVCNEVKFCTADISLQEYTILDFAIVTAIKKYNTYSVNWGIHS